MTQARNHTPKTETANQHFSRYARAAVLADPPAMLKLFPNRRRPSTQRPTPRQASKSGG